MEEAPLLPAVQRDVGVVEVEHDLARRTVMRLQEKLDQQFINPRPVAIDLVILRSVAPRRVLVAITEVIRGCYGRSAWLTASDSREATLGWLPQFRLHRARGRP